MLYYFSEYNYRGNHAGTKARNDVETILHQSGAKPVNSNPFILRTDEAEEQIYSNVKNRFELGRLFWDVRKIRKQTVLVQYPMLAFDFQEKYFKEIAKKNKLVLLIHDLHALRIPDDEKLKQEIHLLNIASVVIVHNQFMAQKIRELGVTVPKVYCLEMFDYLHNGTVSQEMCDQKSIAFAGNLGKSIFLPQLVKENPEIMFRFYGMGWNDKIAGDNVTYCGSFKPEEIPEKLNTAFGLVWDGESTTEGAGPLGEYTRINNPHKFSLYLAAGIPVIAWSDAAIAEVIRKYKVGIVVEQIDHLDSVLCSISEEEYADMKRNVMEIREKLISGYYLKNALAQLQKEGDS